MMPQYTTKGVIMGDSQFPVIDVRSDTLTRPSQAMREAMYKAEVGDDVYQEDPTVNALEERVAKLFNKEASIFVPTGTMGNLVAILAHCDRRGCEIIVGDQSHTFLYEQGGPAQLGGVHTRTVPNLPDGTFDLGQVEASVRGDDVHSPVTALIVVENTQNMCGGKVLPMAWLRQLADLARKYKVPLHMDGARVFNAAKYLNLPVADIVKDFASVQFCFSKGLGTPVGSMLVGSKDFIAKARRLRKVMGAAMRQIGVLAAPCMVALDVMVDRLDEDHKRTRQIAQAIADLKSDVITVDLDNLHTNILMIHFDPKVMTSPDFCTRMMQVTAEEAKALKEDACIIRLSPRSNQIVRLVVYYEITDADVKRIIQKIKYVVQEVQPVR